jgi:outer membrane protein assembly factor BamB
MKRIACPQVESVGKAVVMVALGVVLLAAAPSTARQKGGDRNWAQWRGPRRDGKSMETHLLKRWPEGGPRLLWSVGGLGEGFGSVAIADGTIYVTGMIEATGHLFAFDLAGRPKWKRRYGPEWNGGHPGTRCTPTINDGSVYVMSGRGGLVCMDAASGAPKWSLNVLEEFGGRNRRWGFAESVLIVDDKVIATPGGRDAGMVALDKTTGNTVWTSKALSELSGFCSPLLFERGSRRIIATMTDRSIVGVDAGTGRLLWRRPYRNRHGNHPVTPLHSGGWLYATSGYGGGGVMLALSPDGATVTEKWTDKALDCHHGGVVLVDGHIYGAAHHRGGKWTCLDWKSGKVMWQDRGVGKGSITYADGMLYCYGEKGTMGLVRPSPAEYDLASSFQVTKGSGPHWAHPVVFGGRLYIRHGDVLMAYDVRAK